MMNGTADDQEKRRFGELHLQRSQLIIEMPADELLDIKTVQIELPPKARIEPSEACSDCGEPTMRTKLKLVDGRKLCRSCLG